MNDALQTVWTVIAARAAAAWQWLQTVNWSRWWPVPALGLALILGYCAHTSPAPRPLSPPPPVHCDCLVAPAHPTVEPAVSKPPVKRSPYLPNPPVKRALSCADVPPAAYRAPGETVLAEAKRRGYGPITLARLKVCLEKHHG